jgi:hypothetical protein
MGDSPDNPPNTGELVLCQTEAGPRLHCRFVNGEIWLTQAATAELYATTPQNITMHLAAIFEEGEQAPEATCKEFLQVRKEGARQVKSLLKH